jgi:hypothetical protein
MNQSPYALAYFTNKNQQILAPLVILHFHIHFNFNFGLGLSFFFLLNSISLHYTNLQKLSFQFYILTKDLIDDEIFFNYSINSILFNLYYILFYFISFPFKWIYRIYLEIDN